LEYVIAPTVISDRLHYLYNMSIFQKVKVCVKFHDLLSASWLVHKLTSTTSLIASLSANCSVSLWQK